jgi:ribulose kinase
VGIVGNGCITPGQLCLITGSSHLHCVVSSQPLTSSGIWGAYRGAPLSHLNFAEGGQSSTGSILRWVKNTLFGAIPDQTYKSLDDDAAAIPPGCDGLVALETFQGSRTPVTDPLARGALLGLTLSHTQAHIWRACLEAVCFGTRACIEGLEDAGHSCTELIMAGGSTRSPLWLQLHADITGKPVLVCENSDAPLLGCAILAAVGVGIHDSVESAVRNMVRTQTRVEPNPTMTKIYTDLYEKVYSKVSTAARPVVHAIADLRGGASTTTPLIGTEDNVDDGTSSGTYDHRGCGCIAISASV